MGLYMTAWGEETQRCETWLSRPVLQLMRAWILELSGYFSACSHRGWVLATYHRTLFHASLSCLETNAASSWFFWLLQSWVFIEYLDTLSLSSCNLDALWTCWLVQNTNFTNLQRFLLFTQLQKKKEKEKWNMWWKHRRGDWILHLLHVETKIMWIGILQVLSFNCEYPYNSGKQ